MEKKTCAECANFYQHYRPHGITFVPIHCGHCARPRLKHREPESLACEHFVPRQDDCRQRLAAILPELERLSQKLESIAKEAPEQGPETK